MKFIARSSEKFYLQYHSSQEISLKARKRQTVATDPVHRHDFLAHNNLEITDFILQTV